MNSSVEIASTPIVSLLLVCNDPRSRSNLRDEVVLLWERFRDVWDVGMDMDMESIMVEGALLGSILLLGREL